MSKHMEAHPHGGSCPGFVPQQGAFRAWPVSRRGLAALKDLGMSDDQIARYFGVTSKDVERLESCERPRLV